MNTNRVIYKGDLFPLHFVGHYNTADALKEGKNNTLVGDCTFSRYLEVG